MTPEKMATILSTTFLDALSLNVNVHTSSEVFNWNVLLRDLLTVRYHCFSWRHDESLSLPHNLSITNFSQVFGLCWLVLNAMAHHVNEVFKTLCEWAHQASRRFYLMSLSGEPDYFGRNKILSGYDLSHYQVPHCIRVFFYFVWFVFIHHNFQFYFKLCTYCNILDIYLS